MAYSMYHPGTITLTNGATAIVGVGTDFTRYAAGDRLTLPGIGGVTINTITDALNAQATTAWASATVSGAAYDHDPMITGADVAQRMRDLIETLGNGNLQSMAGLASDVDKLGYFTGSGTMSLTGLSAFARTLLDDADAATARATVGLGNVDNTSDANKPISTATQTALDNKISYSADVKTIAQQSQARANIGADALAGFRNKIINGDFVVWQRGTSQTTSGYGSDDRWINENSGSTKTHSQQSFALGQTDVPGNPRYFSQTILSSVGGSGNYIKKSQKIEGLQTCSGTTVTLTFYAKADLVRNIAVEFVQDFGTGGTPSAQVTAIGSQLIALSTAWQRFDVVVALPSIAGKTLGSSGNDHLEVNFWFEAGSNYNARTASLGQQGGTFDIAHVCLVKGDASAEADPFAARHPAQELSLCERYYWRWKPGVGKVVTILQALSTTSAFGGVVTLPVEMRAIPTVGSEAAGEFVITSATGTAIGVASMALDYASQHSFGFSGVNVASGLSAGDATILSGNGSSAALIANAEL